MIEQFYNNYTQKQVPGFALVNNRIKIEHRTLKMLQVLAFQRIRLGLNVVATGFCAK